MSLIDCPGCDIPAHIRASLVRYVDENVMPGGFLQAALSNNLAKAIDTADDESLEHLRPISRHIYNCLPGDCWGSVQIVKDWVDRGDWGAQ